MNKGIVIGTTTVIVIAIAGGGTYAVLHTPKRQFDNTLTKMSDSKDNVADFRVKVSGDDMSAARINGNVKIDADNKNNMDLTMNVSENKKSQKMHIKADKNNAYLSAAFLTDSLKAEGLGDMSSLTNSLNKYWLDASDTSSYGDVKTPNVKSDGNKLTAWFDDLDGSKFEKVSDGYRVNLNKSDMKRLMNKAANTKSGKDIPKSDWNKYKSSINDVNKLKFNITVGNKGQLLKMNFSGKEDGQLARFTFKTTTKRNDKLKVKMPAKKLVKSETELTDIIQEKAFDYYSAQFDDAGANSSSDNDDDITSDI